MTKNSLVKEGRTLNLGSVVHALKNVRAGMQARTEVCRASEFGSLDPCINMLNCALADIEASFPVVDYTVTWTAHVEARSAREAAEKAADLLEEINRQFPPTLTVEWNYCGPNKVEVDLSQKEE